MRISTRGRYSVQLMVELARREAVEDSPVSLATIAAQTRISHGYLEQLALELRRAGLVRGVPGRHGGYLLCRPADEISLLEVVEAVLGPVCIVECVASPEACPLDGDCECRQVFGFINRTIVDAMAGITIAGIADGSWPGNVERSAGREQTPTGP